MTSRKELVFLLEEESAKAMLESLLPRLLDDAINPRIIAFEGKQDLEKQMVRRLRGYLNPHARFIVMRDQDSAPDPRIIKNALADKACESGKQDLTIIRIACRELESFYLADLLAVESALEISGISKHQSVAKYRTPDLLHSPSVELLKLTKNRYEKVSGSRLIGKFLSEVNERSSSFKNLLVAINRHQAELLSIP